MPLIRESTAWSGGAPEFVNFWHRRDDNVSKNSLLGEIGDSGAEQVLLGSEPTMTVRRKPTREGGCKQTKYGAAKRFPPARGTGKGATGNNKSISS
jgi:hypothetical protein